MPGQILPPPLGTVSHVAYVVEDMERALKYWIEVMNAGPSFCLNMQSWKARDIEVDRLMWMSRWQLVIPGIRR